MKVILKKTILDKLNEAYDNSPKGVAIDYIEVTRAEAEEFRAIYGGTGAELLTTGSCDYWTRARGTPKVTLKLEPQTKATTATEILMRERASLAARGYPSHSNAVLGATSGRAPWATEIINPRTWC